MRILPFVLMFVSSDARPRHTTNCPSRDPLGHTVHLPHPEECGKYLRCDHGVGKEENCPIGLHFNPVLQVCDWPSNAGCLNLHESSEEEEVSVEILPDGCPSLDITGQNTFFPHPKDCSKFFKCENGSTIEENCPYGLHFHPLKERCDWPDSSQCSYVISSPATTDSSVEILPNKCPFPDQKNFTVHLPHEKSCFLFYRCDHGHPKEETCPGGLHFNAILQICDWPEHAGCKSENITISTGIVIETTEMISPTNISSTQQTGNPSTETTTSSFSTVTPIQTTELPIDVSHETTEDLITSHSSTESSVPTTEQPTTNESLIITSQPITEVHITTTEDSISNEPSIHTSEPSTVDPLSTTEDAITNEPTIHTSEPSTDDPLSTTEDAITNEPLIITSKPDTNDSLSTTKDPITNEPTIVTSEPDTNDSLSTTKDPITNEPTIVTSEPSTGATNITDNALASSSSIPDVITTIISTSTSSPILLSNCPEIDPLDKTIHLPHKSNCSKFLRCDHGIAKEESCPGGLHFNPFLQVCDWPNTSVCKMNEATIESQTTISTNNNEETTTKKQENSDVSVDIISEEPDHLIPKCDGFTKVNEKIPDPENCSVYLTCENDYIVVNQCPDGHNFDVDLLICDWACHANCDVYDPVVEYSFELSDGLSR